MAEEQKPKPQRRVTVTVQALAKKQGAQGPYDVLTTPPRPGMKFPDTFNVFKPDLVKGIEVGNTVVLVLEQGNPRKDGRGYYENVIGIEHLEAGKLPTPGLGVKPPQGLEKPDPLPWHRFVAWGEIVEQALKMAATSAPMGEEVPPDQQQGEYAKRFEWALGVICSAIRQQMKEG